MRKKSQGCFPRRTSDSQSPDAELGWGNGFRDNLGSFAPHPGWVTRSSVLSTGCHNPWMIWDNSWCSPVINTGKPWDSILHSRIWTWRLLLGFSLFTWVWAGNVKPLRGSPIPWGLGDINTFRAFPRKLEKAGVTEVLRRVGAPAWLSFPCCNSGLTNCSYLVVKVSFLENHPLLPHIRTVIPYEFPPLIFPSLFLHGLALANGGSLNTTGAEVLNVLLWFGLLFVFCFEKTSPR